MLPDPLPIGAWVSDQLTIPNRPTVCRSIVYFCLVHPVQFNPVQFSKTVSIRYNFAKMYFSEIQFPNISLFWRRRRQFGNPVLFVVFQVIENDPRWNFCLGNAWFVQCSIASYCRCWSALVHPVQFYPVQFSKTLSIQYNFAKLYRISVQK